MAIQRWCASCGWHGDWVGVHIVKCARCGAEWAGNEIIRAERKRRAAGESFRKDYI